MDENSCVLLPLATQLKKAEYLESVLCPGTACPLPAKWWQCLKSSSKAMLRNKHWCKSCEKDPAPASWAIFCNVSSLLTYYQGQHIVTAEGRTQGTVLWRALSMPVSAAAFGQAGRDVLLPTSAQLSLEAESCVQVILEGDTMPSCAQLPLLPTASGMDSSPAGEHAGNLHP